MKGAIRSKERYLAAALRRRTERFDHCFPRGISLGDVDSFVEINGHYLFIEWKLGDQQLPTGQRIAFERLAMERRVTVFVLWISEDGFLTHAQRLGPRPSARVEVSEELVALRIKDWVAAAHCKSGDGLPEDVIVKLRIATLIERIECLTGFLESSGKR